MTTRDADDRSEGQSNDCGNEPTPEAQRERIAKRLTEVGASTQRIVDVHDGGKGTRVHTQYEPDNDALSGNYGIYGGPGGDSDIVTDPEEFEGDPHDVDCVWIADIDVDDYNDADGPTEGLESLPDTLVNESPHTDGDKGGHKIYAVRGHVAKAIYDRFGVKNPSPSWGEVRVYNQYVVGPGSQIHPGECEVEDCGDDGCGCSKEWCDNCEEDDGGYYQIAQDRPIAEVKLNDFVEAIATDLSGPQDNRNDGETDADTGTDTDDIDNFEYEPNPDADIRDVLRRNRWMVDYLAGEEIPDDRSKKDLAVCRKFVEAGISEEAAREKMCGSEHTKAGERADDPNYWAGTWNAAIEKELKDGEDHSWVHESRGETDETGLWHNVRLAYAEEGKAQGRLEAAQVLDSEYAWLDVIDTDEFMAYDEDTGQYHDQGKARAKNILDRELGPFFSTKELNEIVAKLEARNQARKSELNASEFDDPLLCVGDGVVNMKTGELLDHDPKYKFIRGLEWDLDPDDYEPDPEAVLDFIDDITRRVEDRDTLLDHLAHGLIPGHPWRKFVIMYGPGSNGKTQLGELFMEFVGKENAGNIKLRELCSDDFAKGSLPGKFINVGDDIDGGTIKDVSLLKSVTGSGRFLGNAKYQSREEFTSEAAMFFSANEPPRFEEDKDSIDDRLYPIRMPYQFKPESEYDPDKRYHKRRESGVAEKLANDEAAMSGLLTLCVEHAQRLFETDGEYSMPEDAAERREMYRAASDPFKRFLRDCLTEAGPDDGILKDDAYTVYTRLCDADDERAMGTNSFKNQMSKQTAIDWEEWRTPRITPGDERQMAYQYVAFSDEAKPHMDERLAERYFGEGDGPPVDDAEPDPEDETEDVGPLVLGGVSYDVSPLSEVATAPTGYVNVTVELGGCRDLGVGDSRGVRVRAHDTSGETIDVVSWEEDAIRKLKELEGKCVALCRAEVDEYEGNTQLKPVDVTKAYPIDKGVGYTPENIDPNNFTVETFGGDQDTEGLQGDADRLVNLINDRPDPVTTEEAAEELAVTEERAEKVIEKAKNRGTIHRPMDGSDGWVTAE